MNSIVFTHCVAAPSDGVSNPELALDRLGSWLDAERTTLGQLLAQAGRRQATAALETLEQLHLEPNFTGEELRDLLEQAGICLEVLLKTLREMPRQCRLETAWGLPGANAFDTTVRWSGARVEDILYTLHRALAL